MRLETIIRKVDEIPSSVFDEEVELWHKYIALLDSPLIVDFGTGWGKSAISLALCNSTGKVVTCDPGDIYIAQKNAISFAQYEFMVEDTIKRFGLSSRIKFYLKSALDLRASELIDVLNLDSDGSYGRTFKEMERWVPMIKKGGVAFFHSYKHPRYEWIGRAVRDYFKREPDEVVATSQVSIGVYKI